MADERSCTDCIYRHITSESGGWLAMYCKRWKYPYQKQPFYDVPCEYYESKEESNGNTSTDHR